MNKVYQSILIALILGLPALGGMDADRFSFTLNPGVTNFAVAQDDSPWWQEETPSHEDESPWWQEDSPSYEEDDPWWQEDSSDDQGSPWRNDDSPIHENDGPWWSQDTASDYDDEPWWSESEECSGIQCEEIRVWWDDAVKCVGRYCDDPWSGSTRGCQFDICNDDSFLVHCSFVTIGGAGVEGACEGPLGQADFDNCYPVDGSGARVEGDAQTFRCADRGGQSLSGYPLHDIAPNSDDDVVFVLCSSRSTTVASWIHTCEDPASGIDFYTCDRDPRVMAPSVEQAWYICER